MDLEAAMHDAEFVSQGYAKRNGFARTDEWKQTYEQGAVDASVAGPAK